MVMGYQAYAGNGLLDGITTGVGLRKAYDDMKRQQQLQERSDNFGTALSNYYSAQDDEGRQAALQEMAKNDPASTLTFQKNNKDSSFGVGTAKGEYLQIQALLNDPLTPETMKENLKRRASVLEKIPDIAYSNAYAGRIGTLQADLGLGGQVEAEKTIAREDAKNKAELGQKAENMKRNMPSFYEMADELISLADKATYTQAGQLRDSLLRQTGRPMSEGGIAREKYDEIVKNELLPKLRETFGGQLSDSEREALLGTLGNVNLSPEEKKQAVRAFIEAKERQLRSYGYETPKQEKKQDQVVDWSEL